MKVFSEYQLKNLTMKNRMVMPPMCMYSAGEDGKATDFHLTHYETRAIGGVALIIVEATGILPEGRISNHDLGIWDEEHIKGLTEIASRIVKHGALAGIQLAHAGRKSVVESSTPLAPSPIPFDKESKSPHELKVTEIHQIIGAFQMAAIRSVKAGYHFIELHAAHGYLIHEFLSPVSNHRQDEYGGNIYNRTRLLKEVIEAVKRVIPKEMPLGIRVSASDYIEDGINCDEMVKIVDLVKENLDIVHVSSGGMKNVPMTLYPGYQLAFAEQIKNSCHIPTIAVGLITTIEMAEEILMNNRSDLVAYGRLLLRNPYFPLQEGIKAGFKGFVPKQYERSF